MIIRKTGQSRCKMRYGNNVFYYTPVMLPTKKKKRTEFFVTHPQIFDDKDRETCEQSMLDGIRKVLHMRMNFQRIKLEGLIHLEKLDFHEFWRHAQKMEIHLFALSSTYTFSFSEAYHFLKNLNTLLIFTLLIVTVQHSISNDFPSINIKVAKCV